MNNLAVRPIRLAVFSTPAHLAVVRAAVGRFCESLGLDPETVGDVILSVDEAMTNIIRHAYRSDESQIIEIELSALEDCDVLRVRLRDYARDQLTGQVKAHQAEDLTPGGLGLLIIRHCMDRAEYRPTEGGGTTLVMEKNLRPSTERTETMNRHPQPSPIRSVRTVGQNVVVEAAGDIDLKASHEFQQALLAVADGNPKRIVVDLSQVPYMDSSGVASLVKLLSRARKIGASLHLVAMNDRVRSIFEITRLDKVFDIRKTQQEALETE